MAEEGQGFIPILCGPVPCINTTVGSFPSTTGTESVPASDQSPVPILTSGAFKAVRFDTGGAPQSDCSKQQQDTSKPGSLISSPHLFIEGERDKPSVGAQGKGLQPID